MARPPRIDLPNIPQHIIQRGVNRSICFGSVRDREVYLGFLRKSAHRSSCRIHAYVLMSNHVHLLATGDRQGCIPMMMQRLGSQYVRWFNTRHGRTGTLWEGRYRSSPIDSDSYLLACYRYIETNPVRAGIVSHPEDYLWSSYPANALGQCDRLISPHDVFLQLHGDASRRRVVYQGLFDEAISTQALESIRAHTNQCKAWGSNLFTKQLAELAGRDCGLRRQGRPKKRGQG